MLTKAKAAELGRLFGWTIKWSNDWDEFQCYPKGEGMDHPSSYGTDDVFDAVSTAAASACVDGRNFTVPGGFVRKMRDDLWLRFNDDDTVTVHETYAGAEL